MRREMVRWWMVMSMLLASLLATSCVSTPRADEQPAPPEIEMDSPDFTLETTSGEPVTLSEQVLGGPVVLVFYRGHW